MRSWAVTGRLGAITFFIWIANVAGAKPNWVLVGREENMGASIYVDADSINIIEDQMYFAASLVSYDDVEFFEDRNETIGSIIELNYHDCANNLVFPLGVRYYSSKQPREQTFVRRVDLKEILGHTPGYHLTNTEGPAFDYVCGR